MAAVNQDIKDLAHALSRKLSQPLSGLVADDEYPKNNAAEETKQLLLDGAGITITKGESVQVGNGEANITCSEKFKLISLWSSEIQIFGHLRVMSSSPHRLLDVNQGPVNTKLVPPCDPLGAISAAPELAFMTVSTVPIPGGVTGSDQATPLVPPAALGTISPLDTTMGNVPFVIIPDHTHGVQTTPVEGTGATIPGTTVWTSGPTNAIAKLRGVKYEYLFGYNRQYKNLISKLKSSTGALS